MAIYSVLGVCRCVIAPWLWSIQFFRVSHFGPRDLCLLITLMWYNSCKYTTSNNRDRRTEQSVLRSRLRFVNPLSSMSLVIAVWTKVLINTFFILVHRELRHRLISTLAHQSYTHTDHNIRWTIYNILTYQLTCKFSGKLPIR